MVFGVIQARLRQFRRRPTQLVTEQFADNRFATVAKIRFMCREAGNYLPLPDLDNKFCIAGRRRAMINNLLLAGCTNRSNKTRQDINGYSRVVHRNRTTHRNLVLVRTQTHHQPTLSRRDSTTEIG